MRQLAESKEFPYEGAAELLAALGPEQASDRLMIFNRALANFEQNGSIGGTSEADMGTLVERSWRVLPSSLVLEAIDKLLEEAKEQGPKQSIVIGGQDNNPDSMETVPLNSSYELRLFQLLPTLEELDKDKADSLLRDDAELKAKLKKFPKGPHSIEPEGHVGIVDVDDERVSEQLAFYKDLEPQIEQIKKELETDPARALADAVAMPLGSPNAPFSPKLLVLGWVGSESAKKNAAIARAVLDEAAKLEDRLVASQLTSFPNLPELYVELGDKEGAERSVATTLKIARKIYAWDTDSDDPNQAFKEMWPSTAIWERTLRAADKLSPALAQDIIADIPDPEIAAVGKLQEASILLGKPLSAEGDVCHRRSMPFSFSSFSSQ